MSAEVVYSSILYWRRSRWNGARCEPVLMTLDQRRLRAYTRDGGAVFDAAPDGVAGRVSQLGTLILTVGGETYQLVGRGAAVSPAPSASQRQGYVDFWAHRPKPVPSGRPGLFDQIFNGSASWHMRSWRDALTAAGATIG